PEDGKVVACDVSDEYTRIAQQYWAKAGISRKVDLRLGPALETLDRLVQDGWSNTFDFAFIDADKTNYLGYFERCLDLIRPGGVIAADNVLWSGRIADPADRGEGTEHIREFNRKVRADTRVAASLVPLGDGLTVAVKA
ncbi:MAG TPA: class I SAM-dependent methyltransferase, partial [Fimbriimonadaceae bacterium]|nr:class I SAM-dependent methyltransferase [Fimbriimonadaceae bacterium]